MKFVIYLTLGIFFLYHFIKIVNVFSKDENIIENYFSEESFVSDSDERAMKLKTNIIWLIFIMIVFTLVQLFF